MSAFSYLLVDGNNLAFQALGKAPMFYNGQRTEMIKISLAMIRSWIVKFSPHSVVVCWDGGRDERRLVVHPEYKRRKRQLTDAERQERKAAYAQMDKLIPIFSALGLLQFKVSGREGDDLIYTVLRGEWIPPSAPCCVISTDCDMLQLLEHFSSGKVSVYSPVKRKMYDVQLLEREYGIPAQYFSLYRAMVGDDGDNLPGIRGIGPKKAIKIIEGLRSDTMPEDQRYDCLIAAVKDQDELARQLHLTSLMEVSSEEVAEGFIAPQPFTEMETQTIAFADALGFEQILGGLGFWLDPFVNLRVRRER